MGLIQEAKTEIVVPTTEAVKFYHNGFIKTEEIENYWPKLRLRQLNTTYRWLFDLPRGSLNGMGFGLKDGELGLIPIDVERYFGLLGKEIPLYFLHDGFERDTHIFESQEMV